MYCTKCGKELNPNDRFCANCGAEVKPGQGDRKYDNVVFNPPFRMEAEKKTAQILKNREEFRGFKELADENNKRAARSKAKMDWNLEGFPESLTARNNKSGFDWDSVIERRRSGRSFGFEKLDFSSTMEHKKIDPEMEAKAKAEPEVKEEVSLGLPPEDGRVISLEELEKELYDLEEELRTDTARTAKYEPLKDEEIDNSDELDAYLDGISKTKKTPEKKEQKEEKITSSMKWNFNEPSAETPKEHSSMGLVWGIDPEELHARRKASKQAKKKTEMVWDTDEKKTEPVQEAEPEPEPVQEQPAKAEAVPQPEPVSETAKTIMVGPVAEEEQPSFLGSEYDINKDLQHETAEPSEEEAASVEDEVSEEYKDLIKNAEHEYLDKTRVFDQASLFAYINEEKARIQADAVIDEEPETPDIQHEEELIPSETVPEEILQEEVAETVVEEEVPEEMIPEEIVPEEVAPEEIASKVVLEEAVPEEDTSEEAATPEEPVEEIAPETELPEEETSEEAAASEEPVEEILPETPAPLYQSDFIHPWEQKTSEPQIPDFSEEIKEEAAEDAEGSEASKDHTEPETPAERPQFYTFSQKNEAFQELLQREKARLESMGPGYVPRNEEIRTPSVKASAIGTHPEGFAYEEAGRFVEEVVQPIETTIADLTGDAKPEHNQFRYDFSKDIDWLSEIKSQTSVESLNKTKKRYSEIFAKPITEDKYDESVKYEEKTLEEKKRAAEEINKIFDEDENTKPKKHIIGNTIIILLILLILFEGSVLAAKLLVPDSSYAHLTDGIIEKVMDLVSGNKSDGGSAEPAEQPADGEETSTSDAEAYYPAMVSELANNATTIGEITYNEALTYQDMTESEFEGVIDMETLQDSEWIENEEGRTVTYAEAVYDAVIAYYDSWLSGNTDEELVGINRLELGEIRTDGEGYYALVRVAYADSDGGILEQTQTCYLTENGNSMFIERIATEGK